MDALLIEVLVQPFLAGAAAPDSLFPKLAAYLELLLKWNARTNLTSIREPEEMVRRHFGESLFAALHLPEADSLLDFGSGGGFPGLPIQLWRPSLAVTLAESQNKKATFLREVVRTLGLVTEVWAQRVEAMPANRQFDVVALRAVDQMEQAIAAAAPRARRTLLLMTTEKQADPQVEGFAIDRRVAMPKRQEAVSGKRSGQQIVILRRI